MMNKNKNIYIHHRFDYIQVHWEFENVSAILHKLIQQLRKCKTLID